MCRIYLNDSLSYLAEIWMQDRLKKEKKEAYDEVMWP